MSHADENQTDVAMDDRATQQGQQPPAPGWGFGQQATGFGQGFGQQAPLLYQQAQWQQPIHAPGANGTSIAPIDEVFSSLNVDLSRYDSEVIKMGSFKLVTLGDNNFREWEECIQRFCRMKRILGLIDGSLPRPLSGVERAHWNIYADFLALVMTNHATTTQRAHLQRYSTPKQIYNRWREVHAVKFRGRLVPLLRRIMTKKAERNESVDNVSADLRNLVEQVTLINGKPCVNDEILGMAIISAFSEDRKYNLAIYNLENDEGTFTPEKVVSRLKAV